MTLVMPDELFDAQLVRALAYARHGGADVGQCVETGRRIARADPDRWFDEWFATAARVELIAEVSAEAGRQASARDAYPAAAGSLRLALMGWSFGGYTAPRAATAEHRLAACRSHGSCGPRSEFGHAQGTNRLRSRGRSGSSRP